MQFKEEKNVKKSILKPISVWLILAALLICTLAPVSVKAADHEHEFVDGLCTVCGKYEVSFSSRIPIKDKLTKDIEEKGTIETLEYATRAYAAEKDGEEIPVTKHLQVYLPYGYDPAQTYNVLYLTHGAGESEYYWLNDEPVYEGTKAMGKTTKAVLNNMIKQELCDPLIVVAVTSITEGPDMEEQTSYHDNNGFAQELRNDIVPFVESQYSTYAQGDVSEENLIATRDHRGFAGFSMGGGVTASQVMMPNLDMFSWFGTYSPAFGEEVFPYTPEDFQAALESFGLENYPIHYWFNGDGTADFVLESHVAFNTKVLELMPDWFQDGKNYAWIEFKGGSHAYNCWIVDLYDSLLVFFK